MNVVVVYLYYWRVYTLDCIVSLLVVVRRLGHSDTMECSEMLFTYKSSSCSIHSIFDLLTVIHIFTYDNLLYI